jgi:hypothetical protein
MRPGCNTPSHIAHYVSALALQAGFQALPRGGAESDFSALVNELCLPVIDCLALGHCLEILLAQL